MRDQMASGRRKSLPYPLTRLQRRVPGRGLRPVELLENRRLLAATLTPDSDTAMAMTVGDTGEFQVFYGDYEFGHIATGDFFFGDDENPTDEQPALAGVLVRLYDGTAGDGSAGPGTTYGLRRVFPGDQDLRNFTPVDQGGDGTGEVTTVFAADDVLEIAQTVDKPFSPDDPFVRVTNVITNTGGAPLTFDFFAAADLGLAPEFDFFNDGYGGSFGSRDEATGVTTAGGIAEDESLRLFFQSEPAATSPALPAPLFEAGGFDEVWDAIQVDETDTGSDGLHLDSTPDAEDGYEDNAAALEWRAVTIAPGASQTVSYYVAFEPVSPDSGNDASPQASLQSAPDERGTAATSYRFTVDYYDDLGVNADTVGDRDVEVWASAYDNDYYSEAEVEGLPDGADRFPQAARLVAKEAVAGPNGEPGVRATYEVRGPFAPGATGPSAFQAGQYQIYMLSREVTDNAGQPVPSRQLGTFEIGPPRLAVTPTADAAALQSALFGDTGVTVTGATVSSRSGGGGAVSVGTYASNGEVYDLPAGNGLVLGTGDVRQSGSGSGAGTLSTEYGTAATAAEQDLLEPLAGGEGDDIDFRDVTRIDLTFDAPEGLDEMVFNFVFGTEENRATPNIDVFGLYVNGQNVAFADESFDEEEQDRVPANSLFDGDDSDWYDGTKLDKILTEWGSAPVSRIVDVNRGGNTLTLIIADGGDAALDSTAYVTATTDLPGLFDPDEIDDEFGEVDLQFNAEAVTYDGDKVIVAGWDSGGEDEFGFPIDRFVLQRRNPDGTPDPTFGGDGQVETLVTDSGGEPLYSQIYDVEVSGERIYVVGEVNDQLAVGAYRRSDGTLDTSFSGDGIANEEFFQDTLSYGLGNALTFDGDKIVVTGETERPIGGKYTNDLALARFNPDGSLDTTFVGADGPGGRVPDGLVVTQLGDGYDAGTEVVVQGERIIVAGYAGVRVVVAAYHRADGTPDTSFDEHLPGTDPDGKVVVTRGGVDLVDYIGVVGMTLQPDGKIVVVASAEQTDTAADNFLDIGVARLQPDGRLDESFGGGRGFVTVDAGGDDYAEEVAVVQGGNLVVSGRSESGDTERIAVVRLDAAGNVVTEFGDGGVALFDPTEAGGGPADGPGPLTGISAGALKAAIASRGPQSPEFALVTSGGDSGSTLRELSVDRQAPTAALAPPDAVTESGTEPASLRVTFTDASGVDVSDLTAATLAVTRPAAGGVPAAELVVTGVTLDADTDGSPRVATYTVRPADGSWDAADVGSYLVTLKGGLIGDVASGDGNLMPGGQLGVLTVAVPTGVLLGTAGARKTTFTESGLAPFTVTVKGGTAEVYRVGDVIDLVLPASAGGAAAVTVTTARGAAVRLGNVTAPAGLRSLTAKTAGLTGTLASTGLLGKVVLGAVDGARVEAGGITSLQAASLTNAQIRTTGSIVRLAVTGPVNGSTVFAGGVPADLAGLPDGRDDFANPSATIAGVNIRGAFSNSRIAAPVMGKVALGSVQTANGGAAFGLAASAFASVKSPPLPPGKRLDTPGESKQSADYVVRVLGPAGTAAADAELGSTIRRRGGIGTRA